MAQSIETLEDLFHTGQHFNHRRWPEFADSGASVVTPDTICGFVGKGELALFRLL